MREREEEEGEREEKEERRMREGMGKKEEGDVGEEKRGRRGCFFFQAEDGIRDISV